MQLQDMTKRPRWTARQPPNVRGAYRRWHARRQARCDAIARAEESQLDGGGLSREGLRRASPYVRALCDVVDTVPFPCERCGRTFVGGGELCPACRRRLGKNADRWTYWRDMSREGRR